MPASADVLPVALIAVVSFQRPVIVFVEISLSATALKRQPAGPIPTLNKWIHFVES